MDGWINLREKWESGQKNCFNLILADRFSLFPFYPNGKDDTREKYRLKTRQTVLS
jgi:hypothetical protein